MFSSNYTGYLFRLRSLGLLCLIISFLFTIWLLPSATNGTQPPPAPIYLGVSGTIVAEDDEVLKIYPRVWYSIYEIRYDEKIVFSLVKLDILDNGSLIASLGSSTCPADKVLSYISYKCLVTLHKGGVYTLRGLFKSPQGEQRYFYFKLYVSPKGRILLVVPEEINLDGYEEHYERLIEVLESALVSMEKITPNAATPNNSIGIAFSIHPAAFACEYCLILVYGGNPDYWKKVFDNGYYLPPNNSSVDLFNYRIALDTLLHEIAHLVTPNLGSIEESVTLYYEMIAFTFPSYQGRNYELVHIKKLSDNYLWWASILAGVSERNLTFTGALYWVIGSTILDVTHSLRKYIDEGFLPAYADILPEIITHGEFLKNVLKVEGYVDELRHNGTSHYINLTIFSNSYGLATLFASIPPDYRCSLYLMYKYRVVPRISVPELMHLKEDLDEIYYTSILLSNITYGDIGVIRPCGIGHPVLKQTFTNTSNNTTVEAQFFTNNCIRDEAPIAYFLAPVEIDENLSSQLLGGSSFEQILVAGMEEVEKGFIELYVNKTLTSPLLVKVKLSLPDNNSKYRYQAIVLKIDPATHETIRLPASYKPSTSTIEFIDLNVTKHAIYMYELYDPLIEETTTYTKTHIITETTTKTHTITHTITTTTTKTITETHTISHTLTTTKTLETTKTHTITTTSYKTITTKQVIEKTKTTTTTTTIKLEKTTTSTITTTYKTTITNTTTTTTTKTIIETWTTTNITIILLAIIIGLTAYALSKRKT